MAQRKKAAAARTETASTRPTRRKPAARRASTRKKPARREGEVASTAGKVLPVEVEAGSLEATLERLREELQHWMKKGRYTKVRFKLRGKQLLPDLPVGAVLAAEALSFWWAGLLRVLAMNLGARALLDVELVSAADEEVGRGQAALLGGDLERAQRAFEKALEMDRDCASAHLNLGVAHKLKGERRLARELLEKAEQLDPKGPTGDEARRLLDQMAGTSQA